MLVCILGGCLLVLALVNVETYKEERASLRVQRLLCPFKFAKGVAVLLRNFGNSQLDSSIANYSSLLLPLFSYGNDIVNLISVNKNVRLYM